MGMFDFLKKNKAAADLPEAPANTLLAVQNGKIVPVDTLPDPFSRKRYWATAMPLTRLTARCCHRFPERS